MLLIRSLCLVPFLLVLLVGVASATTEFADNFDSYTDGQEIDDTVENPGTPWTNYSGTPDPLVTSGELVLDGTDGGDIQRSLPSGPFQNGGSDVIYAGFSIRVTTLPTTDTYCALFKSNISEFLCRFFITNANAGAGSFRVGISNESAASDVQVAQDLSPNVDYNVVIRLDMSGATPSCTLWLNPTDEGSSSVTAADAGTNRQIYNFAFRQSASMGVVDIDNLTVADTFAEAAPPRLTFTDNDLADANVQADADGVIMARFTVSATNGTCTLQQVSVTASGTGDDMTDVSVGGVRIWQDDGDNVFESGADTPGSSALYGSDDGTVDLVVNNDITPGTDVTYFVVYTLSGSATDGETFAVQLAFDVDGGDIVSGDPMTGRTVTIAAGAGNGGDGSTPAAGGGSSGGCVVGTRGRALPVLLAGLLLGLVAIRRRV